MSDKIMESPIVTSPKLLLWQLSKKSWGKLCNFK